MNNIQENPEFNVLESNIIQIYCCGHYFMKFAIKKFSLYY